MELIVDRLILKYLSNNLDENEAKTLQAWLESNSENRDVFENIVGAKNITYDDLETAKRRIFERVSSQEIDLIDEPDTSSTKSISLVLIIKRVAAVVVIGLSLTAILFSVLSTDKNEVIAATSNTVQKSTEFGQKLTFNLPDGSTIKLNSGTEFTYYENNVANTREVFLSGEAFFDVARNENKPFIIHSENIDIHVLGTSFNVRAFSDDEEIQVAVATGKVAVNTRDNTLHSAKVVPGQMISYSPKVGKLLLSDFTIEKQFGWKENLLIFRGKSLEEVLLELRRWYGVKFEVHSKELLQKEKKITGKYQNESLEVVLKSLSVAYDFEFIIDKNQVFIQ